MTADTATPKRSALEDAVTHAIEQRQGFAAWPAVLRRAYFDQGNPKTHAELRHLQIVGLGIAVLTILLDAVALPDQLMRAIVLRGLLVIIPSIILIAFAKRLSVRVLKLGISATLLGFAATVMHLASFADAATATRHTMAITLLLTMTTMLMPFLREELVSFTVGLSVTVILTGIWPRPIEPQIMLQHMVLTLIACGAALAIAVRHVEEKNRNFLYDLRDSFVHAEMEQSIRVLRELSEIDSLTGLANRRSFRSQFDTSFAGTQDRGDCQISVLMIDLDHFKLFNDEHGHQAGDRALRSVGRCLEAGFSGIDGMVARFGGEEFIAAFSSASLADAERIAEDVRVAVQDLDIRVRDNASKQVTASIGIASTGPGAKIDMGELTARADRALYQAKRSGRNRVVLSERIELRVDRLAG